MSRLLVIEGPWKGLELALTGERQTLGRGEGCALAIPDTALSREHCAFVSERGGWRVEDLGSKNGVTVNGERVERARRLVPGDHIALGRVVARYIDSEEVALVPHTGSVTATLLVDPAAAQDLPAALSIESGSEAEPYFGLLQLADRLLCAETQAESERVVLGWMQVALGAKRARAFCRRGERFVLTGRSGERGEAGAVKLPAEALAQAERDGRTLYLPDRERGTAVVPVGRPAKWIVLLEECAKPPSPPELLALAHASRLIGARFARSLEVTARVDSEVELVAGAPCMTPVLAFMERVAQVDSTVLLCGESGSGKELVARTIHRTGLRAEGPLVTVNCAALPTELVESELFGHEKGAFTGAAARRIGRFERAHGGTIFLDEIGDLLLSAQGKLLRVLEEQTLERVGGDGPIPIDVRVIAATHRNLDEMIRSGAFREDLYYRLSVLVITIPPLRERAEDIHTLAERFISAAARRSHRASPPVDPAVWEVLLGYPWPGNVRELRNVLERAVILGHGPTLGVEDLSPAIRSPAGQPSGSNREALQLPIALAELEKLDILAALETSKGNKAQAARVLGIDRTTLYARLKAYGISG